MNRMFTDLRLSRRVALTSAALGFVAVGQNSPSAQAKPRPPRAPKCRDGLPQPSGADIARAQIFDDKITTRESDLGSDLYEGLNYHFIWGARSTNQPVAQAKPSVYRTSYRDADNLHDLAWYQANKPHFLLYLNDRSTPAWYGGRVGGGLVTLNITHPEVREYYFDNFVKPKIDAGWQTIALDNVSAYNTVKAGGYFDQTGKWVQAFETDHSTVIHYQDPQWAAAVVDWITYLCGRIRSHGVLVAANIALDLRHPDYESKFTHRLIDAVDIFVEESGFTRYHNTDDLWLARFRFVRSKTPIKPMVQINQTLDPDIANSPASLVNYGIANYLLTRESTTMLALTGLQQYGSFIDLPKLNIRIGKPTGIPSLDQNGLWKRQYSKGFVAVNPSSTATTVVDLPPGLWVDLDGVKSQGPTTVTAAPVYGNAWTRLTTEDR